MYKISYIMYDIFYIRALQIKVRDSQLELPLGVELYPSLKFVRLWVRLISVWMGGFLIIRADKTSLMPRLAISI